MAKKVKERAKSTAILREAHRINYRLRSVFFYRKLHEYQTLEYPSSIARLLPFSINYDWENYRIWGITPRAHSIVQSSGLDFIQIFAHPKLLREQPALIGYYRNVSVLSQKATRYLTKVSTENYERADPASLSEKDASTLAKLFNEHSSLIVEGAFAKINDGEINGLLLASTGAQIDGSWRNEIGEETARIVQTMLMREAMGRGSLSAFIMRTDGEMRAVTGEDSLKIVKNVRLIKGLVLKNQKSILFASEPDLTVVDKSGKSVLAIEVKGGTDPAGALERFGAALKSFRQALKQNKTVKTCLLAACITPEVEKRAKKEATITRYFNLAEILMDESKKDEFLKFIFEIIES